MFSLRSPSGKLKFPGAVYTKWEVEYTCFFLLPDSPLVCRGVQWCGVSTMGLLLIWTYVGKSGTSLFWADEYFVKLLRKIFWLMRENVYNTTLHTFSWRCCHLKQWGEIWQHKFLVSFPRKAKILLDLRGAEAGLSRKYCRSRRA